MMDKHSVSLKTNNSTIHPLNSFMQQNFLNPVQAFIKSPALSERVSPIDHDADFHSSVYRTGILLSFCIQYFKATFN